MASLEELSILLDGNDIARLLAQVVQELCNALVAVRINTVRVDDPDLAEMDSSSQCGAFGVTGDELHILDSLALVDC